MNKVIKRYRLGRLIDTVVTDNTIKKLVEQYTSEFGSRRYIKEYVKKYIHNRIDNKAFYEEARILRKTTEELLKAKQDIIVEVVNLLSEKEGAPAPKETPKP